MKGCLARYPGAQPFVDEVISRSVFFGRHKESSALTDQISVHRLVVVYAKSGLGKTSLLQAGISQLLRDDGYLPLFVRVNDIKRGPRIGLLDDLRHSAARQSIEYISGNELSLWHFFKTAEFWNGDSLLTPVLVLDQFEELFTLQPPEARSSLLAELGNLVRGVRPALGPVSAPLIEPTLTDTPPAVRIVISLREEYLGALEEAADSIPQILDHRFRLLPLSVEAAAAALEGPAKVDDERFATQPFAFEPDAVNFILAYLSQRSKGSMVRAGYAVEPFNLQLICQRVETLVSLRQEEAAQQAVIALNDLGGVQGLNATLQDFYRNVVAAINPPRTRKRVRRLCELHLISPEGRRLSLDEIEVKRILKLDPGTLRQLVDRRLLRSDQRADSWYYELSHDSLVAPILTTQRKRRIAVGALGLLGSLALGLPALGLFLFALVPFVLGYRSARDIGFLAFVVSLGLLLSSVSIFVARRSLERLNLYVRLPQ
jgi:hypothetical protein